MNDFFSTGKRLGRAALGLAQRARAAVQDSRPASRPATTTAAPEAAGTAGGAGGSAAEGPRHRRYLSERPGSTEAYLQAACDYVAKKRGDEHAWLYCKPYERGPGNPAFYSEMYQVMNLLKAMDVPCRGRILEVGSGPGWVTEILVALGFEVHGLEPSADMIAIARERVAAAIGHWRIEEPPPYEFHCQTLEDCTLAAGEYDAILFHAALHHVIDEDAGMAQCFRLLRPGGVLGVCEGAWEPGNAALEAALDEEMARFGTLENPYTREYLDHLLHKHGFVDVQRYHSINGFVPEAMGPASVESLADMPARSSNNLTAVKPGARWPTTRDHAARTAARIDVLGVEPLAGRDAVRVKVRLANTGETAWLHRSPSAGWVTVAVRTDPLGAADFRELPRRELPYTLAPGTEITLDLVLALPAEHRRAAWCIDLVNEGIFWFSTRGTKPAPLVLAEGPA